MFISWKKSKSFLQNARSYISNDRLDNHQLQILKDFDEYIECNELGLAFDQLEFLAENIDLPVEFWKKMFLAAKQMELENKAQRCKQYFD
jgi:hypothetical protein